MNSHIAFVRQGRKPWEAMRPVTEEERRSRIGKYRDCKYVVMSYHPSVVAAAVAVARNMLGERVKAATNDLTLHVLQ